jgi:hypothetical protein
MHLPSRIAASIVVLSLVTLACRDGGSDRAADVTSTAPTRVARSAPSATPATTVRTPVPTVEGRAYVTAFGAWTTAIFDAAMPLAPLMATPRLTDRRWRAAVREAATAVQEAIATPPRGIPPACLTAMLIAWNKIIGTMSRMADELLGTAAYPSQARLAAAQQAYAAGGVYLENMGQAVQPLPC